MSHSNKTPNYSLPIFSGSDVPSWLTDFNSAMQEIDRAIANALTVANQAETDATVNESALNELRNALNEAVPVIETTSTKVAELSLIVAANSSAVEKFNKEVEELKGDVGVLYTGILSAGETTLTLSCDRLTKNSLIDVYTDVFGMSPTLIETDVPAKTLRLTFPIQTDTLNVKVKVGE